MSAKLAIVLSATLAIAVAMAMLNPGNVFTRRSAKFTMD